MKDELRLKIEARTELAMIGDLFENDCFCSAHKEAVRLERILRLFAGETIRKEIQEGKKGGKKCL